MGSGGPQSREWFRKGAHVTVPSRWRRHVICSDDCDSCPLAINGCASRCTRWDDLICADCPCLATKTKLGVQKRCVDPAQAAIVDMPCGKMPHG
jgi:hypothetical protein